MRLGPDCILATYGSLAPGQINHHELDGLCGHWHAGTVRGFLVEMGWGEDLGYPALVLDPEGDRVAVSIFESTALPDHWPRLDAFEGGQYQRCVAAAETERGSVEVSIYILRD